MTLTHADIERYVPPAELYGGAPGWLDELDLRPAPPHLRIGTRALGSDAWLLADELRPAELALRERLLAERRDEVFAALPDATAGSAETLALVREWAREQGFDDASDPAEHPLGQAGRLVQEDLCVMVRHDDGWYLDAGVVCFPSLWRLREKLGRHIAEVHATVAHYDSDLRKVVDTFFDRLDPARPVLRRNLSVKTTNALFLPVAKRDVTPSRAAAAPDGSPYWLRSERQTLRRLPESGAILFTIRTQLAPARALTGRPDVAARMLAMYRSWDAEMNAYKMAGAGVATSFLAWLEQVAGARAATPSDLSGGAQPPPGGDG